MPLNLNKRLNDIDTYLHQAGHGKGCPGRGTDCTCGKTAAVQALDALQRALDKMGAL